MKFDIILEILKYIDFFGTPFTFYIEKNRKLYTPFGGILTLLSIIFSIIVFLSINLDDFLHNIPNSTTSIAKENIRKIKFNEEKIWIPWHIVDIEGKTLNHEGLLYPIIYYYTGFRNNSTKFMDTSYEILNYKLCKETPMVNNSGLFLLDIDLEQFYCIDMEDLDMGGNWDSNFINYISFDLYICKNGIDYDENNKNCTTYEKMIEIAGSNNSFKFEMYYPVVNYYPMNKTNPIFVEYKNYFYHLSRFSQKIDRIYLQQHILIDDNGWIIKNEKIYSNWGMSSLSGDSYSKGNKRDLMNEGSTSRFYSFNIYIDSNIIYYHRSYKKIFLIIADGLPIVNIIIIIFGLIARIFKISSRNKKLTELLFENIKEKRTFKKLKSKKIITESKLSSPKHYNNLKRNLNNTSLKKNINDLSSIQLIEKESAKKNKYERRKSFNVVSINNSKLFQNSNNQINFHFKKIIDKSLNNVENSGLNDTSFNVQNNIEDFFNDKNNNDISSNLPFSNLYIKSKYDMKEKRSIDRNIGKKIKTRYVKKSLFPYKYYLCSVFIKNIDNSKNYIFLTKKFIAVYNFICQLFDISSYLILQREFQTMKNTLLMEEDKHILEKGQKINVNDRSFNNEIKDCLNEQKLSILGKIKKSE